MKQKTRVLCDNNTIVFEKDVLITKKEKTKLDCIILAHRGVLANAELGTGVNVSVLQVNGKDQNVFRFTRKCTRPIEKEDFDEFEESVKDFMAWFTNLKGIKETLSDIYFERDKECRALFTQLEEMLAELNELHKGIKELDE